MAWEQKEAQQPRLGILLSIRENATIEWVVEFARACERLAGLPHKFYLNKHFRVDVSRNQLVEEALADGCEKVLFIDTDIIPFRYNNGKWIPFPDTINLLWSQDYPICSIPYWTKRSQPAVYSLDDPQSDKPYTPTLPPNIEEIINKIAFADATGLGYCLIDTRVFERIEKPYFLYQVDEEKELSEDLYFFWKCKEAGFRVLVDCRVIGKHIFSGFLTWGNVIEYLKLGD